MSEETLLDITVSPKSSRSEIRVDREGNIRAYLNSPPVEGKANAECVALFARSLRLPKGRIRIDRGERGRKKRIAVAGMSREEILRVLRGNSA